MAVMLIAPPVLQSVVNMDTARKVDTKRVEEMEPRMQEVVRMEVMGEKAMEEVERITEGTMAVA